MTSWNKRPIPASVLRDANIAVPGDPKPEPVRKEKPKKVLDPAKAEQVRKALETRKANKERKLQAILGRKVDPTDWAKEKSIFGAGFDAWRAKIKKERGFDPVGFYERIINGEFLVNAEGQDGEGMLGIAPFVPRRLQRMWFREIIWHRWAATDEQGWIRYQQVFPQRAVRPTGRFARLVVKYRRAGFSTGQGIFYVAEGTENRGCNAVLTAHSGDGLDTMSELLRTALGRTKKDGAAKGMAQRRFETSNDSVTRLLGPNDSMARGWNPMHLGWTEADYAENMESALDSALPSVNKSAFATVVAESTMRMDGATEYKDFIMRSLRGETSYQVYFQGWMDDETASIEPVAEERAAIENKQWLEGSEGYEELLLTQHNATLQQVAWWRVRFREDARNSLSKMKEMYPTTLEEAISSASGVKFLHDDATDFQRQNVGEPEKRFRARYDALEEIQNLSEWANSPHLAVWEMPIPGHQYVIGTDGADASNRLDWEEGSECYLVVLNQQTGEQVAEWHGFANPQDFAIAAWRAHKLYNFGLIVPEQNACKSMIDYLVETLECRNVYERESFGAVITKYAGLYGFDTRGGSRAVLVQRLQDNYNRKTIVIRSKYLLEQMENAGRRRMRPNKQQKRKTTECDDGPMALGLCMFGHQNAVNGAWSPKDLLAYGERRRVTIDTTQRAQQARNEFTFDDEDDDNSEARAILNMT